MNLDDAKKRIQTYLKSDKSWPIIVDVQTKQELGDVIDFFKIGNNKFPNMEKFCDDDGILKLDELYAVIAANTGSTFITGITGFLKLSGEEATRKALKTIVTTNITGHVVVLTYQCKNYLKFADPRIAETGRIVFVDGTPDNVCDICLISPTLSNAFPDYYQGIQKVGYVMEHCLHDNAYIATNVDKSFFSESSYHIAQLSNGYDILKDKDSRTTMIPESFGTADQWNYVLSLMGSKGNWSSVIEENFGHEANISHAFSSYQSYDDRRKWLYFVALSICGVKDNAYLQLAVNNASNAEEFVKSVFRAILTIDRKIPNFESLYNQRKAIISEMKNVLPEAVDFCKVISVKGEDAIYYLTDLTQPEKERIIAWLEMYGGNYSAAQLVGILKNVYPDLSKYLSVFRFKNELLDSYFSAYKYQKVINHILPSFEAVVDEQSTKRDFVSALKSRTSYVDKIDVQNAHAFFFDALGVEFLGYIQEKCNEYDLAANITCARSELPTLTCFNKEFVETLSSRGCSVSDIKDLDEVKHHGEDNFDYEKEKLPLYLIKELEIIDGLLNKIRSDILGGHYDKAIVISDHGASRLAVLHETENVWSMATAGEHSGRCCPQNEIDTQPDFAISAENFWVLANYDRFRGGRKANVEVHGGASLEEVTVPIIEITQKKANVEAFIVDESKTISLGAKEHAVIRIYVGIKSNNISIKIDGNFYDADPTADNYIYVIDLPDYTKKGKYSFDIMNGSETYARDQMFEIKKKGFAEVDLFG